MNAAAYLVFAVRTNWRPDALVVDVLQQQQHCEDDVHPGRDHHGRQLQQPQNCISVASCPVQLIGKNLIVYNELVDTPANEDTHQNSTKARAQRLQIH
jgi:hypothetical protein